MADEERRLILGNGESLFPAKSSATIMNVPLTRSHFLDAYSKGKWNLSKVPCPKCFEDVDLMIPPDHYNEATRLKAVKKFKNNEQWKNRELFNKLIGKALKYFNVSGASISLIDGRRQIVKYQVSLNINECPKKVSLDAHTILSTGSFVLLDASKDWRTSNNPFVKGSPFIKFYAGVPLITKFGVIIGVFSIFDSFPKQGFNKNQINFLIELSNEVINILTTPAKINEVNHVSTIPLIKIIGRPTSQASQFSPIAVYEKDGSGTQYSQNFNFRYNKIESNLNSNEILMNDEVIKQLTTTRDIKTASCQLSKIICNNLNFDLFCIIEIRVSQSYQISSEFFPQENIIDAESFKFANELIKIDEENVMSRVLGSYGYNKKDLEFNSNLYYLSLSSEFGIFYENTNKSNIKFQSGIIMPFYRLNSKLVRKRKIIRNNKSKTDKPIEVYLRSGGFLIAGFSEKATKITDEQINFIYGAACSLRRIFISN